MKKALIYSLSFHLALLLVVIFGLPHAKRSLTMAEQTIVVEVANISELTNLPKQAKKTQKPKPAKVKEMPKNTPAPPPEPTPAPPVEKTEAVPDLPKETPAPPKAKPKPPAEKPKPKEEKKDKTALANLDPDQEDDFLSVVSAVEKIAEDLPHEEDPNAEEEGVAPGVSNKAFDVSAPLSVSEVDALRQQIEACWNLPAGARYAEELIVEIAMEVNPDGTVRNAEVVDKSKMRSDPFFRAAAESALRAVLNPACSPLKLPPNKYEEWRYIRMSFDPRSMLGY